MTLLAEKRKKAGYTQCDFARALGVSQSTYCQYEVGSRSVPASVVNKICELLGEEEGKIFLAQKFTVSKT